MNLATYICFSRAYPDKFMSRVIRWWTKSEVSHCVIVYYDTFYKTRMVLTADEDGFVKVPWERWEKQNFVVHSFILMGNPVEESIAWLGREYLGTKYDYGSFWANAVRHKLGIVWKILGPYITSKLVNPQKLICSESVIRFLNHAKYSVTSNLNPELTDHEELLQVFLQSSTKEVHKIA